MLTLWENLEDTDYNNYLLFLRKLKAMRHFSNHGNRYQNIIHIVNNISQLSSHIYQYKGQPVVNSLAGHEHSTQHDDKMNNLLAGC